MSNCETGYFQDMILYTSDTTETVHDLVTGQAGSIVKKLIEPHLSKGHILYCEKWYTSLYC